MAAINEWDMLKIDEATQMAAQTKEWFGLQSPIDETELRDISLIKIKDLNAFEREILQEALYAEATGSANMDLVAGDIVCSADWETLEQTYTTASADLWFLSDSDNNRLAITLDCGNWMVIDYIKVQLKRTNIYGLVSGTMDCELYTGFAAWDTSDGVLQETSTNSISSLTTSYVTYTFNFSGEVYRWDVFFVFSGFALADSGSYDYPLIYADTSQDNSDRFKTYREDGTVWIQQNDVWVQVWGEYDAGYYTVHWDRPERTKPLGEVLEDVDSWGTVKLNITDVYYKQSGLSGGTNYFIDKDWLASSGSYPIGVGLSSTKLRIQEQPRKVSVGSFTRSGGANSGTQDVAHWLDTIPKKLTFYYGLNGSSSSRVFTGTYDWTTNTTIWPENDAASTQLAIHSKVIYRENTLNNWQSAEVISWDATNFTLDRTELGTGISDSVLVYRVAET